MRLPTATVAALLLLAVMAPAAHAVPVDCLDTLSSSPTLQALLGTNAGGGCFIDDKLFTNFVYTGAGATQQPANEVSASIVFGAQDIYGVLIAPTNGTWSQAFSFGFVTTICTSLAQGCIEPDPLSSISEVKQQTNTGLVPNSASFSTNYTPNVGAPFNITTTGASVASETVQLQISPKTQIVALGTYNGSSQLLSVEISYFQTTSVPEPASMTLVALGLAGLCACRRRQRRNS